VLPLSLRKDLANEYNKSTPWIRKQILDYEPPLKSHNPKDVIIVCDVP